ncbi:MAG: hypothetical protein K1X74_10270 [Pirellulales bacterium]|nr:hypothetical protein [Pirellulales bacterium]
MRVERLARRCLVASCAWVALGVGPGLFAAEAPDTQQDPPPRATAEQAAALMQAPPGFRVEVFAAEPLVRQPIAIATDARGRFWVAENNSYTIEHRDDEAALRDRIVCLIDTDGDGRADEQHVFWDQAYELTSIEVGRDGLWALCPPRLLFLPDRDHDDRLDGDPEVALDGFDLVAANRHNFANGLKWGPDGWLYGRNGITHTAHVGRPGALPTERVEMGPGMWRFDPRSGRFEVVATGTTNPWGHDWDRHGELFFINTVIGHLWHVVPGAHFKRMFGADPNPYAYELIDQTADHFHWDTTEPWHQIRQGTSSTTAAAGGGHAHSGLLIDQGGNWPAAYRDRLYTVNLHGHQLNCDRLERVGASYVARHGEDLFATSDPWFRGIDLLNGPDGAVYLADWSDVGECHERDGVHRSSGRIYRLAYGKRKSKSPGDFNRLSNPELVAQLRSDNIWHARWAQRVLQFRHEAGQPVAEARDECLALLESTAPVEHRLRALWTLHVTGGVDEPRLCRLLATAEDEHLRVWAVRLLVDHGPPSDTAIDDLAKQASTETSGLVLVHLASAAGRLPLDRREAVLQPLVARGELADDRVYPLMLWYAVEPLVPLAPRPMAQLAVETRIPRLARLVARRVAQGYPTACHEGLDILLAAIAGGEPNATVLLPGIGQGLHGRRRAPKPQGWDAAAERVLRGADAGQAALVRRLAAVFGDGLAVAELQDLARDTSADATARRDAIRSLVETDAAGTLELLAALLADHDVAAEAVRGLGALAPNEARAAILARLGDLIPPAREAALGVLAARPASAVLLLERVVAGNIARDDVALADVRLMQSFADPRVAELLRQAWPELRPVTADKQAHIARLKQQLQGAELAAADMQAGRGHWERLCAKCHTLFGSGGKIGPDLTGAQRANLDYLLENIVDPGASLAPAFRMSTLELSDGRVVQGVIVQRTAESIEVQTATERLTLAVTDVETTEESALSLMPDGLLDLLSPADTASLIRFLQSDGSAAGTGAGR